jgi:hypothetical protein
MSVRWSRYGGIESLSCPGLKVGVEDVPPAFDFFFGRRI